MKRTPVALLAAAIVVAGAVATGVEPITTRVVDTLAGASFLALAVVAVPRHRAYAVVAALAGLAWFASDVVPAVVWVHRPLMLWCSMSYPDGRLARPLPRVVLGLAAAAAVVPAAARSPGASLLLALVEAVAGWRLRVDAPLGRRASGRTASTATCALAAALALPALVRLLWPHVVDGYLLVDAYCALVAVAGLILAVGTATDSPDRETDAVVELTEEDDPRAALEVLRAARGTDAASADSITSAVRLLEANVALRAGLAEKVDDVRASRRRLVEATVLEHRRLEQRLDAGAMRLLDEVADGLHALDALDDSSLGDLTARCINEVEQTRDDLRQLARGLHPHALTDGGLAGALAELADRSPLPVALTVPPQRFPPIVEATVWYACAEALTNAAKHAGAGSAAVELRVDGPDLVAEVRDDGCGGAHAPPRGGLAGLGDRLRSMDGRLTIDSPPGRGTRVKVRVPL